MLIAKGLKGRQIVVQYSERSFIWSDLANDSISSNGYHTGIEFEGRVYDNVHPNGIELQTWLNDFHSRGARQIDYLNFGD